MFKVEQIDYILDFAEVVRTEDREKYRPIYNSIEEYASKHKLILGGDSCIDILKGGPRTNFHYEFYCKYSLTHANDLANYLDVILSEANQKAVKKADMFIITMRTLIPKRSFSVSVNARELVRVHEERNYDSIISMSIENQSTSNSKHQSSILLMPPQVQLINVYRSLYHPVNVDNWDDFREKEVFLYGLIKKRRGSTSDQHQKYKKYDVDLTQVSDKTRVIVPINKPTMISSNTIEEDIKAMEKVYKSKLEYTTTDCAILDDFRLTRYNIKKEGKDFIYLYNSMSYELIPMISKGDVYYTFEQVTLRILLVEIFIIVVYMHREKIDSGYGNKLIDGLMFEYERTRKEEIQFPTPVDYEGIYIPEQMYIKQLQASSQMYDEYIPSEYLKNNGAYRSFKGN